MEIGTHAAADKNDRDPFAGVGDCNGLVLMHRYWNNSPKPARGCTRRKITGVAVGLLAGYKHPRVLGSFAAHSRPGDCYRGSQSPTGTTVVQGFEYAFEDGGNITRIDHEDGSYWEYDYDGRERLVEAVRGNHATPTIEATYAYTYDDGDNPPAADLWPLNRVTFAINREFSQCVAACAPDPCHDADKYCLPDSYSSV